MDTILTLIALLLVAGTFGFLLAIPLMKKMSRQYMSLQKQWEILERKRTIKLYKKAKKKKAKKK